MYSKYFTKEKTVVYKWHRFIKYPIKPIHSTKQTGKSIYIAVYDYDQLSHLSGEQILSIC